MVARTQITLSSEAHASAKRRAAELGISLAEYIRRLVAADLGGSALPQADVSSVTDLGDGGSTDIASEKDRLLAEATVAAHDPAR